MSTTSSKNFTTLYSGSGSVTPQGAYGNANVVGLLSVGTDGANTVGNITATGAVNTTGTISATGNIVTDGYFVGNFAGNITGNLTVPGSNTQVLFNNQGNAGASAGLTFDSTANVLATSGNITAVGNVQGTYFLGNGSQLTGLPATYGNANVTTLLAAFGANTISSTGNITTTANVSGGYILGNGSQLTGLPANYGNANVTTLLAAFGANTISSTGNITTTANVSGGYILGNGSQLTGLPASYSNANVTTLLAAFGSNAISTTGNVTAGYFVGDGSLLTNINAGNIVGSYGNANVAAFMAAFGSNTVSTTGNVTSGNFLTSGVVSAAGNVRGSNLNTGGNVNIEGTGINLPGGFVNATNHIAWAGAGMAFGSYNAGNTVGNALVFTDGTNGLIQLYSPPTGNDGWVFNTGTGNLTLPGNTSAINYANGVNILSSFAAAGSNTQIQFNDGGAFAGNAGMTFNKVNGNVNVPVLISAGNVTSTQQTVIGTANVGTTGNIVVSGKNIATDMAFVPDGGNAATATTSRVVVGTGWNGNISHNAQQQRLSISDSFNRSNTATTVRLLASEPFITLTANITNANMRNQALGGYMRIGGGAAANTTALATSAGAVFSVAAGQFNLDVGNISPYNLGNTTLSHAALNGGAIAIATGSTLTNAYGVFTNLGTPIGAATTGNMVNYMGYTSNLNLTTVPTGNIFGFYHGSNATGSVTGSGCNNNIRQAPGYYAFYNADDLAQIQLGSLRRYHEFEAATATSGSFAIDKNVAQVHNIVPTGNCTITGYANMVTSVSDGVASDAQVDTLTIIVEQGATPYTVTLPTGSTYKYAGNVRNVGTTANSVTMISVTAANVSGTVTYLTTVSPEFV